MLRVLLVVMMLCIQPLTAMAYNGYGSAPDRKYETMYVINCRESITLRTAPNTSATEIRQIPLGAPVSYLETAANGFYKVTYLSDTGYALASYLGSQPQSTYYPVSNETPAYETMFVVNCRESITLRTAPNTSASQICQIPLGASVSYLDTAPNGFYRITYLGRTGYALASYLSTSKYVSYSVPSYRTLYVANCKQSITLRTAPNTKASEICQIPLGASVSFVENAANGFYKVIYRGMTGYALASYLED